MRISLIVPVRNACKYVKSLLKTVVANFDFTQGEVLIIDDCSDYETAEYLRLFVKKYPGRFKLLQNDNRIGYLKSCNKAVLHAEGDILVFLNSDCEIPKHFSKKIVNCFLSDKNIMCASPVSSNSAKYSIPCVLPLNVMNFLFEKRRKPVYPDIFNAEGFCFCVRKDYVDKYGLFDPIYGDGYCEEVDFSFSIQSRGKRCVLIDNLYVLHCRNKSFKSSRKFELISQNTCILFNRWGDFIHKKECSPHNTIMSDIIADIFGCFKLIVWFRIKLNSYCISSRIKTFANFLKYKTYIRKNNRVVYTAIAGDSDIMPIVPDYIRDSWDYVCFTDNRTLIKMKRFGCWKILPLRYSQLDDTKNARWHKTHPIDLFPQYNESLWIDANINILTPYIFDLVENSESELLIPVHYCRKSVYQEAEIVEFLKKDSKKNVDDMVEVLKANNMPDNFGLNETNIIYRQHSSAKVKKLMDEWWFYIEKYSKRDQLSFSYILWKNDVEISKISIPNARIDVQNFKLYTHNTKKTLTGKFLSSILR